MPEKYTEIDKNYIANTIPDMLFVNTLKNGRLSNFVEVNQSACHTLLYTEEEFLRLNPYKIIPGDKIELLNTELKKAAGTKPAYFQLDLLTKDGRKIPVEISANLIRQEDGGVLISIARDFRHHKTQEKRLKNRIKQLHQLASHLHKTREERCSAIARELHDELGQLLTALKIQIVLLSNKIDKTADTAERFNNLVEIADRTIKSVQRITAQLRPQLLDELGLIAAIEWQAEEFQKLTGITCKYTLPRDNIKLDSEKETAIFRILQEALTNVARHAYAKRVSIFLRKRGEKLILEVTDNGDGISPSQISSPKSLGLLGMRERVTLLGGEMEIHGKKNEGTNVKIKIPLDDN
jgi:two-component system sensor histidine kinase UhpB